MSMLPDPAPHDLVKRSYPLVGSPEREVAVLREEVVRLRTFVETLFEELRNAKTEITPHSARFTDPKTDTVIEVEMEVESSIEFTLSAKTWEAWRAMTGRKL